jgi:2-oxoacid:acceptor oxidoreductase gamma subunit (pyruvate/2-ketoisovalerate family)
MIEIRIHGTGGQGVVVAAKLLADAAAKSGYKSQCFSAFGVERRGGNVESYVRISDQDIAIHSKSYEPDYLVLMEENLAKNPQVLSGLKEKGGLLINSQKQPESFSSLGDYRIITIDGNAIARKQGLMLATGMPIINTVILGSMVAMIPMVEFDSLSEAIREGKIPSAEKNVGAAREAYHKTKLQRTSTAVSEAKETTEISVTQFPLFKTKMPPCEAGTTHCVAGEDIRTILSLIQRNQFEEAFENIKFENPFPGVCGWICDHPCETHCNRNQYDQGIAIKALERAVFENADREMVKKPIKREKTGKKVAVIGSGPAGMTCAYFLAILGHEATVFEAAPVLGGMLRLAIPAYSLPKEVVDKEVAEIVELGVKVKTNTEVGKDVSFDSITNEYDACFIGVGAHTSLKLNIPGELGSRVIFGIEFLKDLGLGKKVDIGSSVGVIGGDHTAIDAARTARRLGAREVTIIYNRTLKEMPAYLEEVEAAQKEGIKLIELAMPIKIDHHGKGLVGIDCLKTNLVKKDGEERPIPEPIQGTNVRVDIDTLVVAVGEVPKISFLPPTVEMIGSSIKVDSLGRTSIPGLYAGGDATSTSHTLVEAIGSGKRAAVGIDIWIAGADESIFKYLQKEGRGAIRFVNYLNKNDVAQDGALVSFKDLHTAYFHKAFRAQGTELSIEARSSNFNEITSGLAKNKAIEEAQRCFQCGQCTLCENCYIFCPSVAIRYSKKESSLVIGHKFCKKCGICIEECPRGAISWEVRSR